MSISDKVKQSAMFVNSNINKKVTFDEKALRQQLSNLTLMKYPLWSECHGIDINKIDLEKLILFILCVDSVNFCFWPYDQEFEYDDLIKGFRDNLNIITASLLQNLTVDHLVELKFFPIGFPLIDERCRSLNDLGYFIANELGNDLASIVKYDCLQFANLLIKNLPTFRDEAIYKGKQVFMYKRAQICAADLYSALKEKNIILSNANQLTMFPDYRVPQILNELKILNYTDDINNKIKQKEQILAQSEDEIEIRLMTVYAVEEIKKIIKEEKGIELLSLEVDYLLWNEGEKLRKDIVNHHRTLTIFY